jgi:hypothetical protein
MPAAAIGRRGLLGDDALQEAARIVEVVKTNDPNKAAINLRFLADTGLIGEGLLKTKIDTYLKNRKTGSGIVLPPPSRTTILSEGAVQIQNCKLPSKYGSRNDIRNLFDAVLK